MKLKYTGNGRQHVTGVPARDLSADEVQALASARGISATAFARDLISHGLYEKVKDQPTTKAQAEDE